MKKKVFTGLLIAWMVLIFCMSAQNSTASEMMSTKFGKMLGSWFHKGYSGYTVEQQEDFAKEIDLLVRKSAHASEYAVLGALAVCTFAAYEKKKYGLWAFVLCVVYASSDEFHQLFVSGRTGSPIDVGIDSMGALIGVLIAVGCIALIQRSRKRKTEMLTN